MFKAHHKQLLRKSTTQAVYHYKRVISLQVFCTHAVVLEFAQTTEQHLVTPAIKCVLFTEHLLYSSVKGSTPPPQSSAYHRESAKQVDGGAIM